MRQKLPPCSVAGCECTAGAIVKGALLCGSHALEQLQRRARKPGFQVEHASA